MNAETLPSLIKWMNKQLDENVSQVYKDQPLAQHWARVAKASEEVGEAIDALIGVTGQNPRKGIYGSHTDLFAELADVALSAMYALAHFDNDLDVIGVVQARAQYHKARVLKAGVQEFLLPGSSATREATDNV